MQVLEIKSLTRKDVPIYYRMFYSGVAVIELPTKSVNLTIDFSIEMMPTGRKDIHLSIIDPVDYPIVPVRQAIRKYIVELDAGGKLPI
ncbi:hypothetical protein FACS1894172_09840 [Spirochaetia bacterium]|nr:hypothetical protein FACS1894164_08320 [Spirochaetia bacterium]GHU32719.1 hypothetical protein FACS1894172_09840 [Spirochaetia bacterium]